MSRNVSWLFLVLLAVIWGSSFLLIDIGLNQLNSMQVGFLRITISALTLLPWLSFKKLPEVMPWKWVFLVGLVGNMIPAILFAYAQAVIHSALAGMLNSLQPLFALIFAVVLFNTKVPRIQILGLLTAFCGSLLLLGFTDDVIDPSQHLQYSLLVVLATCCYGLSTNLIRHYCQQVPAVQMAGFSMLFMLPGCLLGLWAGDFFSLLNDQSEWLSSVSAVVLLGSVGTAFALILFNRLIKVEGVVFASMVTYMIPIVAAFWGVTAGEPIHLFHWLGMLVIFCGLWLINRAPRPG